MIYRIIGASKEDADVIAEGIMTAIGEEICTDLAGGKENLPMVRRLFRELAEKETSQYSYLNTLKAVDENGAIAGVIVAYDGADLHTLRQDFVDKYNELFNATLSESDFDDETSPDEIYIDTLMVGSAYRRQGIASMLIDELGKKYAGCGKALGLLVDYTNPNARKLYAKSGFESKGMRKFCGVEMEHMQKALRNE